MYSAARQLLSLRYFLPSPDQPQGSFHKATGVIPHQIPVWSSISARARAGSSAAAGVGSVRPKAQTWPVCAFHPHSLGAYHATAGADLCRLPEPAKLRARFPLRQPLGPATLRHCFALALASARRKRPAVLRRHLEHLLSCLLTGCWRHQHLLAERWQLQLRLSLPTETPSSFACLSSTVQSAVRRTLRCKMLLLPRHYTRYTSSPHLDCSSMELTYVSSIVYFRRENGKVALNRHMM